MISAAGTRDTMIANPYDRRETGKEAHQRLDMLQLRHNYGISAKWWVLGTAFRGFNGSAYPLRWLPRGPNSVLVQGAAGSVMAAVMAIILDSGIRAEILVADPALGGVQVLVDAGWVCIGARPFMRRFAYPDSALACAAEPTSDAAAAGTVVELTTPAELKIAGQIAAEAFGHDPDPVVAPGRPGESLRRVWGLHQGGDLVSCATTVRIGDTVTLWDVATRPDCQRLGYSKALLDAIHTRCAAMAKTRQFLLSSSAEGYRLYESLGYETLAWWQAWSRPRWALAAS